MALKRVGPARYHKGNRMSSTAKANRQPSRRDTTPARGDDWKRSLRAARTWFDARCRDDLRFGLFDVTDADDETRSIALRVGPAIQSALDYADDADDYSFTTACRRCGDDRWRVTAEFLYGTAVTRAAMDNLNGIADRTFRLLAGVADCPVAPAAVELPAGESSCAYWWCRYVQAAGEQGRAMMAKPSHCRLYANRHGRLAIRGPGVSERVCRHHDRDLVQQVRQLNDADKAGRVPWYRLTITPNVYEASVAAIDWMLDADADAGAGWTTERARQRAEAHVKRHGWPGVNALAKLIGDCPPSTLRNAIKKSTYLKARKAEHKATRAVPMGDAVLETAVQTTEPDALNALIAHQQDERDREERQYVSAKRRPRR